MEPLSVDFFSQPTVSVARALVGQHLVHDHPDGGRLVGRIVETEAYTEDDPACHASHLSYDDEAGAVSGEGRGADLFAPPGDAYVYLIYGMHWLLNVVTEPKGTGGAVLIRAVEPVLGEAFMQEKRGPSRRPVELTNGPGKLAEAFDINDRFHGGNLTSPPLYFADGPSPEQHTIATSSRIGISKAVERQWRFYLADHPYVSKAVPSDRA